MKTVFVDTSGFYACLDQADSFHPRALAAFERAEKENWTLFTTNYVVHETWALIQRRLGWEAVETFLNDLLPRCAVIWADENLYHAASNRCRRTRERRFSLTDAISLECMARQKITEAIAKTNILPAKMSCCHDRAQSDPAKVDARTVPGKLRDAIARLFSPYL
ncbi:MAG TPA: PIN domain-containing protein [Verrucomicrobiae bacterium]